MEDTMRKINGRATRAVLSISIVCSCCAALASDTIVLKGGETTHEGMLESYKSDSFKLKTKDGKLASFARVGVESVTLQPPAEVIMKPRSSKKREDLKLKGYEKPDFIFDEKGKELKMPASQVSFIEMALDFARQMQQEAPANPPPAGDDGAVNAEELVKKGIVTVLYFAPVGDKFDAEMKVAGTRSESYLNANKKKMKGKLEVTKVPVESWDSPIAKQYKFSSLPQFWFYNREGELVTKLTDRFSEIDVDAALKTARK